MNHSGAKRLVRLVASIVVLIAAAVYGGDYLWLQLRIWSKSRDAGLGSMVVYYAIALKNGRVEVYYDQPHTETCVHSLFPHLGYTPCWYLAKPGNNVKEISLLVAPDVRENLIPTLIAQSNRRNIAPAAYFVSSRTGFGGLAGMPAPQWDRRRRVLSSSVTT